MQFAKYLSFIFIATVLLRCINVFGVDLFADEAYYYAWSRQLDLGYYDNCPMVAWVMALNFLPGELGLRLPFVLIGATPIVFSALMTRELTRDKTAPLVAALLAATMPLLVVMGSVALYDSLQIALFSCATWIVLWAKGRQWLIAGVFWGLAMLSKWSAALLAPSLVLSALVDPTLRPEMRRPWPYLAVLIGLLIFSPFLIWNWQHDFITFSFFYGKRMLADPRPISLVYALVFGPGPILLAIALLGFAREKTAPWRRLAFITIIPILIIMFMAWRGRVDGNWLDLIYPCICAAAAAKLAEMRKLGVVITAGTVISWVVGLVFLSVELRLPTFSNSLAVVSKAQGWKPIAAELKEYKNDYILASNYQIPSQLSYYGGFQHFGPTFHKASQWNIWNQKRLPGQRTVVMAHREPTQEEKEQLKIVGKEAKIYQVKSGDKVIRRVWVYLPDSL